MTLSLTDILIDILNTFLLVIKLKKYNKINNLSKYYWWSWGESDPMFLLFQLIPITFCKPSHH